MRSFGSEETDSAARAGSMHGRLLWTRPWAHLRRLKCASVKMLNTHRSTFGSALLMLYWSSAPALAIQTVADHSTAACSAAVLTCWCFMKGTAGKRLSAADRCQPHRAKRIAENSTRQFSIPNLPPVTPLNRLKRCAASGVARCRLQLASGAGLDALR